MTAGRRFVEAVEAALIAAQRQGERVAFLGLGEVLAEQLIDRGVGFVALGGSGTVSSRRPIVDARAQATRTHDL